jgi:hypothetical protein
MSKRLYTGIKDCEKITTNKVKFFLSHEPFRDISRQLLFFPLTLVKQSKYTYIKALLTGLCPFIKPIL